MEGRASSLLTTPIDVPVRSGAPTEADFEALHP